MPTHTILEVLKVSDVPAEHHDSVTVAGITVSMTRQRTGFGYRRYFLCPTCGRKCGKIHPANKRLYCQRCTPINLYGYRQSLYDEGGTGLIVWRMRKLVKTISSQPIKWPFHYYDYLLEKPPKMRHKKYRDTLMRLQILENMRFEVIFGGAQFRAADIRRYTDAIYVDMFELWQVAKYRIFGVGIPPEKIRYLIPNSPSY